MSRPQTISNQQILAAARKLFVDRGLDVSTAEIAREAGVSEGSIFKRFSTKHGLIAAAMGIDEDPSWIDELPNLVGQGNIADNLRRLIVEGVTFFRAHLPRIMLLWSRRELPPPPQIYKEMGPDALPRRCLRALTEYLHQESALQRIRCHNPEIFARLLLAGMSNFAFLELIGAQLSGPMDPEIYAHDLTELLLSGVRTDQLSARRTASERTHDEPTR